MRQALDPTLQFPVYPAAVLSVSADDSVTFHATALMLKRHSKDDTCNTPSEFVLAHWPVAYPALSLTCRRFAHLSEAMSPATRQS